VHTIATDGRDEKVLRHTNRVHNVDGAIDTPTSHGRRDYRQMPTRSRADGQSETWNAPEKVSPVSNLALKLPSIPRGLPSGAVATCVRWTDPETALAVVPGPQPPNTLKATAASFVPGSRKRGPSISY